jgi:hypothetical protein
MSKLHHLFPETFGEFPARHKIGLGLRVLGREALHGYFGMMDYMRPREDREAIEECHEEKIETSIARYTFKHNLPRTTDELVN